MAATFLFLKDFGRKQRNVFSLRKCMAVVAVGAGLFIS